MQVFRCLATFSVASTNLAVFLSLDAQWKWLIKAHVSAYSSAGSHVQKPCLLQLYQHN